MDTKKCAKCNEVKPILSYSKNGKSSDGVMPWCKDCCAIYNKDRAKNLIVDYSVLSKKCGMCGRVRLREEYFSSTKSRDGMVTYCKQCYAIWSNNKRAKHMGVPGSITLQEWDDLKAQNDYRCLCCGIQTTGLTIDHVIPLTFPNSSNSILNVQCLCRDCNSQKNDTIADYRGGDRFIDRVITRFE